MNGVQTQERDGPRTAPVRVFISVSREDYIFLGPLAKHLSSLVASELVALWSPADVRPGDDAREISRRELDRATAMLLLVSADYLADESCWHHQFQYAANRVSSGSLRLIPIRVRPVDLTGTSLQRFSPLPLDGRAVTEWPNADSVWTHISEQLRAALALSALGIRTPSNAQDLGSAVEDFAYEQVTPESVAHPVQNRARIRASLFISILAAATAAAVYLLSNGAFKAHGQVWHERKGTPILGAAVLLVGHDCATHTGVEGAFDLRCDLRGYSRLVNPRIRIRLPGHEEYCSAVSLLPDDHSSVVTIDDECNAKVGPAVPSIPIPSSTTSVVEIPSPAPATTGAAALSGAAPSVGSVPASAPRRRPAACNCEPGDPTCPCE